VIHGSLDLVPAVLRILAMAVGAATIAALAALLYRWYTGLLIPEGIPILLGVSVVATVLNTTATLRRSIAAGELAGESAVAYTLAAFAVGTIAADAGRRTGERLGGEFPTVTSMRELDSDVGQLVRAAGRVIRVTVPEDVDDIDGYEPVPADVKADLAGRTFLFPRRLRVTELRDRLVERLKRDYDVGHVDVELADDGTIEYLGLGRRLAGIGQTIPPGSVAVAIRADPPFSATPGDRVQVWQTDGETPERIVTAELRAAVDDVATLVVDAEDAEALDDDRRYRLVTLPAAVQPDREFAALLRTADETMGTLEIEAGSRLDGASVEDVPLTVVAIERDGAVTAIPRHDRTLAPGDVVYVVGRPEEIRRVETRRSPTGEGAGPETASADGGAPSDG